MNTCLLEELTTSSVVNADCLAYNQYDEKLMAVGSTIKHADKKTVIWGSGCIDSTGLQGKRVRSVKAVRGRLTQHELNKAGLEFKDAVLGDPAILLPLVYQPKLEKKFNMGIVPHYVDKSSPVVEQLLTEPQSRFIDVESGKFWKRFIDAIVSCDFILSSSLHAIIVADAYNIPNVWVRFSDKVLGNGFKFRDYYSSVGKLNPEPLNLSSDYEMNTILEYVNRWTRVEHDWKALLSAYPYPDTIKPKYLNAIRG